MNLHKKPSMQELLMPLLMKENIPSKERPYLLKTYSLFYSNWQNFIVKNSRFLLLPSPAAMAKPQQRN
jgi:hypothetical protein